MSTNEEPVKIFNMDDCTWIAARTLDDAWKGLADFFGYKSVEELRADYVDYTPTELIDEDLDRLCFVDDVDGPAPESGRTFREQLDAMIASNPNQFPCFFATTEY